MKSFQRRKEVLIFIASPGDVMAERECIEHVVDALNKGVVGRQTKVFLRTLRWERDVLPTLGRIQGIINNQLGTYHIFIGIMWKRFGEPTGEAGSGTEEEFNLAYDKWRQTDAPSIMFYFCERPFFPRTKDESAQMSKVIDFKDSFKQKGLAKPFKDTDEFAGLIREHLSEIMYEVSDPPPGDGNGNGPDGLQIGLPPPPVVRQNPTILDLNPLEKIPGRTIKLGLTDAEIDYIIGFLKKHHFNIDTSPQGIKRYKEQLRALAPQVNAHEPAFWLRWLEKWFVSKHTPRTEEPSEKSFEEGVPFYLSRYLVTNEQFELFVEQTDYETVAEKKDHEQTWKTEWQRHGDTHPVTCVCYEDAEAFCTWAGFRLPTTEEYERAVRGSEQRLFPWGHKWRLNQCNDLFWLEDLETSDVEKFKDALSMDGIYDLSGNVFEWVSSTEAQRGIQLLAGGSFRTSSVLRGNAAMRMRAHVQLCSPEVGFRFAHDFAHDLKRV